MGVPAHDPRASSSRASTGLPIRRSTAPRRRNRTRRHDRSGPSRRIPLPLGRDWDGALNGPKRCAGDRLDRDGRESEAASGSGCATGSSPQALLGPPIPAIHCPVGASCPARRRPLGFSSPTTSRFRSGGKSARQSEAFVSTSARWAAAPRGGRPTPWTHSWISSWYYFRFWTGGYGADGEPARVAAWGARRSVRGGIEHATCIFCMPASSLPRS